MDILFIKLGALGDVINTLPLAITLKEALGARIYWLVEPLSLPLVQGHPAVHEAIVFDKRAPLGALAPVLGRLRAQKFDVVLDLQRIIKSGLFTCVARARRRIGFDKARCKEMTWLLPFERIPAADAGAHMLSQYMEFARYLGVSPVQVRWDIPVVAAAPVELPGQYVVLNIGATKAANRWSAEGFAALAALVEERLGHACVLVGGPEDKALAAEIASHASVRLVNLAGGTSIKQLVTVLRGAQAVVSADTGPMHLAVALGTPVVALFGPANERRTGPYQGRVVRADMACAPCNKRHCDDARCMRAITPEMVMQALEGI